MKIARRAVKRSARLNYVEGRIFAWKKVRPRSRARFAGLFLLASPV